MGKGMPRRSFEGCEIVGVGGVAEGAGAVVVDEE